MLGCELGSSGFRHSKSVARCYKLAYTRGQPAVRQIILLCFQSLMIATEQALKAAMFALRGSSHVLKSCTSCWPRLTKHRPTPLQSSQPGRKQTWNILSFSTRMNEQQLRKMPLNENHAHDGKRTRIYTRKKQEVMFLRSACC